MRKNKIKCVMENLKIENWEFFHLYGKEEGWP